MIFIGVVKTGRKQNERWNWYENQNIEIVDSIHEYIIAYVILENTFSLSGTVLAGLSTNIAGAAIVTKKVGLDVHTI